MGQVYAIHGLVPSLLIWLAVFLYNPLLGALSAAGALMGSFLPLLLVGNSLDTSSVITENFPVRLIPLPEHLQWTLGIQPHPLHRLCFLGSFFFLRVSLDEKSYKCDQGVFAGSLCSLVFSTLSPQSSSRKHCWQHLVR